jgi:uncharacterized membrane protein YdcZ (DUF606 family)
MWACVPLGSTVRGGVDVPTIARRPKRLWAAAILNFLIGLLAIIVLLFLLTSTRVPVAAKPGAWSLVSGGILGSLLIVYSGLVLKGQSSARSSLLMVATIFYGTIIAQNALVLSGLSDSLVPSRKLAVDMVRHSISLGITWWGLASSKTLQYFAASSPPPDNSLEQTGER